MKHTIETVAAEPEQFAVRYYGQDDHVRSFGRDLIGIFHAAGLRGEPIPHTSLLPEVDPEAYAVNPLEPFFLFSKDELDQPSS